MTVEFEVKLDGKVIEVQVSGRLEEADYKRFAPVLDKEIDKHGKVRILMVMKDFRGWSAGALWEDLKVDFRHFDDIERIAMVGEKSWQKGMSVFCKPFTAAEIRYFESDQLDEARRWIEAD